MAAIVGGMILGVPSMWVIEFYAEYLLFSPRFTITHAVICWTINGIIIALFILNYFTTQRINTREKLRIFYRERGLEICPTCTKPMYYYQPNSSWYCHGCSKYTPLNSILLKEEGGVPPRSKKLEKKEKNILMIIITVFIGMGLLLSIYFYYVVGVSYFHIRVVEYSYIVEVDSNQNPFVIEVPFPINEYGYIEKIFDSFVILEGNCSLNINNSIHGISLMITGQNNVILKSEVKKEGGIPKELHYSKFSMTDYENIERVNRTSWSRNSWFYSNNNSIEVDFQFDYHDGINQLGIFWGRFGEWSYSGSLNKGWQLVTIVGYDAEA